MDEYFEAIKRESERREQTEREAKARLTAELAELEIALDKFLSGEVRDGLISAFKLTLMVQAKTLQALAERSRKDVPENKIRF